MNFLRNLPIKRKLTLVTMVISCASLLLACAAFAIYEQTVFRKTMVRDFAVLADMFDDGVAPGLTFNDPGSIEQTLKTLVAHPRILGACVYGKDGSLKASYQRSDLHGGFKFPPPQPTGQLLSSDRLDTFRDVVLASENIGTVYIGSDLSEVRDRVWRYTLTAGILLLVCSALAYALASRLQAVISAPIVDLAKTASAVAAEKNYSVRAVKRTDDEVGRLVEGFNEMLSQIQARDADLQQSNVRLELRVEERTHQLKAEVESRNRAADALQVSQNFLNSLVENLPVYIYRKDVEGRFVFANSLYCQRRNLRLPEILGKTSRDFFPPEVAEKHLRDDRKVIETGRVFQATEEQTGPNGETIFVEVVKVPVRDAAGVCIGTQGMYLDVTERRRAEEALRESELKFRQFAENIQEVFWMTTPDFHEMIYVSPAYERVWGRTRESLYRSPLDWVEAIVPEDRPRVAKAIEDMTTERGVFEVEYRIQHADGGIRWIRDCGVRVPDGQGKAYRIAGVASDITERKKSEAALQEAHRQLLETSRQAGMAEVATGVLHNVGNVLNSVNVSTTLLTDVLQNSKSANLTKVAAMFREHSADLAAFLTTDPKGSILPAYLGHLAELLAEEHQTLAEEVEDLKQNVGHIKDIVAMQQSYAKVSGVTEVVKVTDLVEDALRMNASALERHAVTVVKEYGPELPPISVEKHKVLQILVNLVSNAKYACDESGKEQKEIRFTISNGENRVYLAVTDNGVGIPRENLTRIFAHGFTTKKTGHGFGLHSGALAAKEMGGALRVYSAGPGHGATFTLELPLEPAAAST